MSLDNSPDISPVQQRINELRANLEIWEFFKNLPHEVVDKAVRGLARGEFKKYTFSSPANGIEVHLTLSERKIPHNPFARFIKWIRWRFIKEDI